MEVENGPLEGLLIIKPRIFPDDRGYFYESYNQEKFHKENITVNFKQDNVSKSSAGVLRGLHFQNPPYQQGKLVSVLRGAVMDVAVDIRRNSATYGQHFKIELSEENKIQFYLPPGFAHGFLTLTDNTIFSYKCTNLYHKESEGAILWNDSDLNIDWNCENPMVSEKDKIASPFKNLESQF